MLMLQESPLSAITGFIGNPTINAIVMAIAGYFLKETAKSLKEMKEQLEAHKLEVARDYATRAEVNSAMERHEDVFHSE